VGRTGLSTLAGLQKRIPSKVKIYKIADEFRMPTVSEIVGTLRNHPLVKNIGRIKNAYLIGSLASGQQNPQSDIDILLEIYPINDMGAEDFAEKKRNQIRKYLLQNNIRGKADDVHPQWQGRRIDLYFTYDASTETRPKIQLPLR